jgi:hypothetical protein
MPEVGMDGQLKLKGAKGSADRYRRIGRAARAVPDSGGSRQNRAGGF